MSRLPRRATDVLLVTVGVLLALAVAADVGRRMALGWRMRVDRHAMRVYLHPQAVDPQLVSIRVREPRDLVCVTTRDRRERRRVRVCLHVAHPSADEWRIVDASREPVGPVKRSAAPPDAAPGRRTTIARAGRPGRGRPAAGASGLSGRPPRRSR
jgi:hypothetical protein